MTNIDRQTIDRQAGRERERERERWRKSKNGKETNRSLHQTIKDHSKNKATLSIFWITLTQIDQLKVSSYTTQRANHSVNRSE